MSSSDVVTPAVVDEDPAAVDQAPPSPRQPAPRVSPLRSPRWWLLAFPAPVLVVYVLVVSGFLAGCYKRSFTFSPKHFNYVAAMYFTVVAISSVGLGDVVPLTPGAKIATCFVLLIGRFVFAAFSLAVSDGLHLLEDHCFDRHQAAALTDQHGNPRVLKRLIIKLFLTLGYVFIFFWPPIFVLYADRRVRFRNAAYASISSMTTTGFGDIAFVKPGFRGIATVWILFSTCLFERAHVLLLEIWLRKRWALQADEVLSRQLTLDDFTIRDATGDVTAVDYSHFRVLEKLMRDLGLMEDRYLDYVKDQHGKLEKSDAPPV